MKMVKIGSFCGTKSRHYSKFEGGKKLFFLKTVSKVILVVFIYITVVKNVINGFNGVKKAHFKSKQRILGENGQNWVLLEAKMTS